MKLKDLTGKHIGKRIKITTPDSSVEGTLMGADHSCDVIDDTRWEDMASGVTRSVPGRQYVGITIQGWGERTFPADVECEIEAS